MDLKPFLSTVACILVSWNAVRGDNSVQESKESWGAPVDGLAGRLVIQPSYVVGEPIRVAIEVKNISARKRYFVPRLDPMAIEWLTLDIAGPRGKLAQSGYGRGYGLGENSFEAIGPGEVKRFEVSDLRRYFPALEAYRAYPLPAASNVATGKYELKFRFRSPKVPERFVVGQKSVNGRVETMYKAPTPELRAGQWAGELASSTGAFQLRPLAKDDLIVHEWGVFTVFNDAKYANSNRKEEWGSLPSFFYRQFPKERLRWVPSAWDKPLVYFYARPKALRINVKVSFTDGAPVVWWPAVASPVSDGGFRTANDPKTPRPYRSLVWDAALGEQVPTDMWPRFEKDKKLPKLTEFPLTDKSWLRDARLPDASLVTVIGNVEGPPRRVFPGALDRLESERFLYYDGLVPTPDYLRCEKVDDGSLTLRNRARFDITNLFVVDRRSSAVVRWAHVPSFKAGAALRVELMPVADWPTAGSKRLRQALLDAGLYEAEADSLLKIWQTRLLEAAGVCAFHVLPTSEYDRMLPLQVLPTPPTRPVRVGIALHPHLEIEPGLAARVAVLIRQLDDAKFETRAAAGKELLEIGPLASALLRAELNRGPTLEVRRRIEAVLERVDVSGWLNQGMKTTK